MGPVLVGLGLTAGFYALIHGGILRSEFISRYFTSHPLEYVTTALFLIGLTILAARWFRTNIEKVAFTRPLVELGDEPLSAEDTAFAIEDSLQRHPAPLRKTRLVQRWQDVAIFLRGRQSGRGLDDHLKHLAELAAERLHGSYSLVRTVTWAIPILGFLGTVIGITIAIANVTPEQLDTSLGEVTSGLAVAFDTTALALALSIVLVFATFVVERSEQQILARVEEYGMTHLQHLFPESESDPLTDSQHQAALQLMQQTEQLIERQASIWNHELETMRARWMETLNQQNDRLNDLLTDGTQEVYDGHVNQLVVARETLLAGFQSATDNFVDRLETVSTASDRRIARLQDALTESTTASAAQMEALHQQGQALLHLFEKEDRLLQLQQHLDDNLEAIRSTAAFDETLHNLTAAVHILTARTRKAA